MPDGDEYRVWMAELRGRRGWWQLTGAVRRTRAEVLSQMEDWCGAEWREDMRKGKARIVKAVVRRVDHW